MTRHVPLLALDGRALFDLDALLEVVARSGADVEFEVFDEDPQAAAEAVLEASLGLSLAERDSPSLGASLGAELRRFEPDPELPPVVTAAPGTQQFDRGSDGALGLVAGAAAWLQPAPAADAGLELSMTSTAGASRVVAAAYELAEARGLPSLTVVHRKAAAGSTDGLFVHSARNVAVRFPEVRFESLDFEAFARRAVRDRYSFDLLVGPPAALDAALDVLAAVAGRPRPASWLECTGGARLYGRHGASGGLGALFHAAAAAIAALGDRTAAERLEGALREAELHADFAQRPAVVVNAVLAR